MFDSAVKTIRALALTAGILAVAGCAGEPETSELPPAPAAVARACETVAARAAFAVLCPRGGRNAAARRSCARSSAAPRPI